MKRLIGKHVRFNNHYGNIVDIEKDDKNVIARVYFQDIKDTWYIKLRYLKFETY